MIMISKEGVGFCSSIGFYLAFFSSVQIIPFTYITLFCVKITQSIPSKRVNFIRLQGHGKCKGRSVSFEVKLNFV